MKQQYIQYIEENPHIIKEARSFNPLELKMLFEIYNDVTGETKAITRCGRCVANTVKTVKFYYEKQRSNN